MTADRTWAINALTALLRTVDLGVDARRAPTAGQVTAITGWPTPEETAWLATCPGEAVQLARHIGHLDQDIAANRVQLHTLVAERAAELTTLTGLGSVVAATALIAWSHLRQGPVRSGVRRDRRPCPIPASSGNTVRRRLNRGGDRRLSRALHTSARSACASSRDP